MKTQARFGLLPLLIDEFPRWLDYFIERCPFKRPGQLECHLKAIALRRKHASAAAASKDPAFVKALYETLHVRGVVADEHRHGIGLGKRAGPRPGAPDTDAADDQERADESVKHRAARRCSSSGPRAGRGAFPQGYIQTGATPPRRRGGGLTRCLTPPPLCS